MGLRAFMTSQSLKISFGQTTARTQRNAKVDHAVLNQRHIPGYLLDINLTRGSSHEEVVFGYALK